MERQTFRVQNTDIRVGDLWVDTGIEECSQVVSRTIVFPTKTVILRFSDGRTKQLPAYEESLVERIPQGYFTGDFRSMQGH